MKHPVQKTLLVLLIFYGIASLIHFIHNAEYLSAYPNLPVSWTRNGVYLVWVGMTLIGLTGWFMLRLGFRRTGFLILLVYAVCGFDSLAHYVVAPMSAHTAAMNITILLEVGAAAMLFFETIRLLIQPAVPKASSV